MMAERVIVSAPGRICLFGEHQDFLGLPVIACPIDLDIRITATPRADSSFHIEMADIGETDEFDATAPLAYRHERDYVRSATNILRRQGLQITRCYDCTINGTIPINAGAASSSALTVAWITLLLNTQDHGLPMRPVDIASWAYEAEVVEFDEPGGMMDHYTSALGGLLYIETNPPISVQQLPAELDSFVVGESLVPKETTAVLRESRQAVAEGLDILRRRLSDFDFRTTPREQAQPLFSEMRAEVRRRIEAQFINRDLCQQARQLLSQPTFDQEQLGELLLEHQRQLRDGIGVSHPKLDTLIEASRQAGALGGKLNGSGGGGTMFAYAPDRQQEVKEAIDAAGGRGQIVSVRGGVSVTVDGA